jgi:hypothetical protein
VTKSDINCRNCREPLMLFEVCNSSIAVCPQCRKGNDAKEVIEHCAFLRDISLTAEQWNLIDKQWHANKLHPGLANHG